MSSAFLISCAIVYSVLTVVIARQAKSAGNVFLACSCCVTAVWASLGLFWSQGAIEGVTGLVDLIRLEIWYGYLLYLYRRSGVASIKQLSGFSAVAVLTFVIGFSAACLTRALPSYALLSAPILVRLVVCVCELLLIENLYFNLPERARWHVALPCVMLGGLACFEILVIADATLFKRLSFQLLSGRLIAFLTISPFLLLTSLRDHRWDEPIRLSRSVIFHSATLILSGSVLLALAVTGEVLRYFDTTWGSIAEIGLVFVGFIGVLLLFSSRSARSMLDRLMVHHLVVGRYDYRVEWLKCISTLSGKEDDKFTTLQTRAIRAVADVVDSPGGTLFLRDETTASFNWASSWNMPAVTSILSTHSLAQFMSNSAQVVDLHQDGHSSLLTAPIEELAPAWLAVPMTHACGVVGIVIVAPPRIKFSLDQEVYDLLGIIGQEVGTYLAEQRATGLIAQTQDLHEYGKRFAFVAHDIKNVASQLSLLLSNAEHHLKNPAFQRDMLATVRSSVLKIDRLLQRLDAPTHQFLPVSVDPILRLNSILPAFRQVHLAPITLESPGPIGIVQIGSESFDAVITHLLNNAIEAAPSSPVRIALAQLPNTVIIEIVDRGKGMSAEFVRDELFLPFKTSKWGGSGIGAFQARELVYDAGGELLVTSEPGVGTRMQILLRVVSEVSSIQSLQIVD